MAKRTLLLTSIFIVFMSTPLFAEDNNYKKDTVLDDAADFFGEGAAGLGEVIEKIFKEHGRPNAIIKGDEASGAIGIGARYGSGVLSMKNSSKTTVHWTGPSIGFDAGANASKVYVLVYHLPNTAALFQRFPAIDGSLYFIGGISANYHQSDNIILAPLRLGAGLRAGVNVGYMKYTRKKTWNPF
jgi:hypothetical protein